MFEDNIRRAFKGSISNVSLCTIFYSISFEYFINSVNSRYHLFNVWSWCLIYVLKLLLLTLICGIYFMLIQSHLGTLLTKLLITWIQHSKKMLTNVLSLLWMTRWLFWVYAGYCMNTVTKRIAVVTENVFSTY